MKSGLAILLFAAFFASLMINPALAFQESHPLDKTSTETWSSYVSRLFDAGELSQAQLDQWNQGGQLSISKTQSVLRTRQETRTRTVPVTRTRTVTNDDGVEVQEPYVETVAQTYTVSVPYSENVNLAVTIPAKNSRPDTATFREFGKLEMPQTEQTFSANQPPKMATSIEDQQAKSKKLSTEDWDTYVERLVNLGLLNSSQLKAWTAGRDININTRKTFTMMRQETRTRQFPVARTRLEKRGDQEVEVGYTEMVSQNYAVAVPYSSTHEISFTLPGRGKQRVDATTDGFSLAGSANQPTKSTKFKKVSKQLLETMKVKPKQQDAIYTQTKKYNKLSIHKVNEDSISGWEVISDRDNKPLRRFLDLNGDGNLDVWIFFKDGKETYRELDFDFDGKVDQYQYTKGKAVRYGIDEDQDGEVDRWER